MSLADSLRQASAAALETNPFVDVEGFKAVAVPLLEAGGLPARQTVGFLEDWFLFENCTKVCEMPLEADLTAYAPYITHVTGFSTDEFLSHCGENGLDPINFVKESAVAKLPDLSINMAQVKIIMSLTQFVCCFTMMNKLDENKLLIRLLKERLEAIGNTKIRTIANFLSGPDACLVFGRTSPNAMPNPLGRGGITEEWLDGLQDELTSIRANIEEALQIAKNSRLSSLGVATVSVFKLFHGLWTWRSSAVQLMNERMLGVFSMSLDSLSLAWSLKLAHVAHLQVEELDRLLDLVRQYSGSVYAAKYVVSFPAEHTES